MQRFKGKERTIAMKPIKDTQTFDELPDSKYGKPGTAQEDEFEMNAESFDIGKIIKEARKEAHLTQEQLATKNGNKEKLYFSSRKREN